MSKSALSVQENVWCSRCSNESPNFPSRITLTFCQDCIQHFKTKVKLFGIRYGRSSSNYIEGISNRKVSTQNRFVKRSGTLITRFPTADPKTFHKSCKTLRNKIKSIGPLKARETSIGQYFDQPKIRKLFWLEYSTFAEKSINIENFDKKSLKLITKFDPSDSMQQINSTLQESSVLMHIYDPMVKNQFKFRKDKLQSLPYFP
jgi:hypothetical protein